MNCFLTCLSSVDDFHRHAVLQWNPFVVSLLSNQYFLLELIWELVTYMHYYFWNLFACSLAKCVEVRLFDNKNKASNFFNMTLKNNYYFWILFATKKPFFLHRTFQTLCECAGVTFVPNLKRDNSQLPMNSLSSHRNDFQSGPTSTTLLLLLKS